MNPDRQVLAHGAPSPLSTGQQSPAGTGMPPPQAGLLSRCRNENRMFFLRKYFVSSAGHRRGNNLDVFVALMFCFELCVVPPQSRLFLSLGSVDIWGQIVLRGGGSAVCGAPSSNPGLGPPGTVASLPTPSDDNQDISRCCQVSPGRHNITWVGDHCPTASAFAAQALEDTTGKRRERD